MIYAFALISFFIVALRQHVKEPWSYRDGAVGSTLSRWIVAGVMSIAIDLVIAGMSVRLVWDLQMEPTTKSLVVTVFALRLFVAPITIVRLVSLSAVDPEDFSFSFTLPEALTQLEMYCNLISATLPSIRLFLTAWNSSFMDLRLEEVDNRAYQEREYCCCLFCIRYHADDTHRCFYAAEWRWQQRLHHGKQKTILPDRLGTRIVSWEVECIC